VSYKNKTAGGNLNGTYVAMIMFNLPIVLSDLLCPFLFIDLDSTCTPNRAMTADQTTNHRTFAVFLNSCRGITMLWELSSFSFGVLIIFDSCSIGQSRHVVKISVISVFVGLGGLGTHAVLQTVIS